MKILYDGIIGSLQSYGGVTVYFNEIIKRLSPDDYKMVSFKEKSNHYEYRAPRFSERYRAYKTLSNDLGYNIFHSTYYRIPNLKRMKVVTTVHDFTYEKYISGPRKWIHSWQKNKAINNSDIVICVSNNTAHDLINYCPIDASRIRVIHNGVSENYYPLIENSGDVLEDKKSVLFVGARGGYKNFHIAVQAVSMVPYLNLHVIGGGELNKNEKETLNRYLPGRYKVLGRVTEEYLNVEYNKAYALLYPSSYEGFGIPIIEAMRAGCPVIAVNISSIPEVAGSSAILVDKPSTSLLYEALVNLPSVRQELIISGFKQAEKFSWDRCFKETLSVYNELS